MVLKIYSKSTIFPMSSIVAYVYRYDGPYRSSLVNKRLRQFYKSVSSLGSEKGLKLFSCYILPPTCGTPYRRVPLRVQILYLLQSNLIKITYSGGCNLKLGIIEASHYLPLFLSLFHIVFLVVYLPFPFSNVM